MPRASRRGKEYRLSNEGNVCKCTLHRAKQKPPRMTPLSTGDPPCPENVKSRGSLNVPIPKHCGTLFLVPHCCVWVLEPSGESTAQAVPLHYNCVRTLGSYLAVMFNTPPSKLGNDSPLSQSSFRNSFPLENKLQNTVFLYLVADC